LLQALHIYRAHFQPSVQLTQPYAMIGVNIIAADTDAEARRLATTQQMSIADLFRGTRDLSKPPIDDIETYWSPSEKAQAQGFLSRSIVGSPATVQEKLNALIAETGADELMIVSDIFDHQARIHSLELIAEAARSPQPA
jgi:alkanesulfonate monooxygenase SsuD/methylene tetrahydromethanopterin reductase-like flavin-dependent oxidoreductase (luciferase family)